ncbi:hypothetical protein UF75_1568 [Desulfosporosinus sp. I2]|nr:hypothetical protein UF75_1568 [Desulfosporosinus sp. I2]
MYIKTDILDVQISLTLDNLDSTKPRWLTKSMGIEFLISW